VSERYRTSAEAPTTHRRKVLTGLTVGLLSVSAVGAVAVTGKAGLDSDATQVETVSSVSQAAGQDVSAGKKKAVGVAGMVFVQSNDPERNSILAFNRAADGSLTPAGEFRTGGRGGSQTDNPFDPLASQESLVFDRAHKTMIAVNAGSNSVTTFRVRGGKLTDRHTVYSGGDFPSSIAVSGKTVYVLNAGGETNVTGFRMTRRGLKRLKHSTREIGITNDAVPLFTDSPPQVGFSPDGKHLLVSTKSANTIEVFGVGHNGRLSAEAVSNKSVGAVPFSFVFDQGGHLLMTEAGKSGVTSYALEDDGTLDVITPSVESGQQVLCWIARAGDFFYGTNPGSSTISLYTVDAQGKVTIKGKNGVIANAGGDAAVAEVAAAAAAAAATEAPATEAPATEAPATEDPATEAPATEAPATEAPATEAPATEAPATEAPATEAPATEAPATEAPATEAPATEAPATEAPGAGPIDLAATADGELLYVQNTLAGTIEGFRVGTDGSLSLVTTLAEGLPVFADGSGMEGLVVW
jgi:6-phosphogluconolactonase (cycloisomerase 2 family)